MQQHKDALSDVIALQHRRPKVCNGEATGFVCVHYWETAAPHPMANPHIVHEGRIFRACVDQVGHPRAFFDHGDDMCHRCNQYKQGDELVKIEKHRRVTGLKDFQQLSPEERDEIAQGITPERFQEQGIKAIPDEIIAAAKEEWRQKQITLAAKAKIKAEAEADNLSADDIAAALGVNFSSLPNPQAFYPGAPTVAPMEMATACVPEQPIVAVKKPWWRFWSKIWSKK